MRFFLIGFSILLVATTIWSQTENSEMIKCETQLFNLLSELREAQSNEVLKEKNEAFRNELLAVLTKKEAFDYPFNSLNTLGKITSSDNQVRIFTWNIELADLTHRYYGFLIKKTNRKKGNYVFELTQYPANIYPKYNFNKLSLDTWYGCLYYDIVVSKLDNKTYYTLLGYDANNQQSDIKIIDALSFRGKIPYLGVPIFQTKYNSNKIYLSNRLFFEYSSKATMSLKYDKNRKLIIYDHLSPEAPNLAEFRDYYVPDMSYDALHFEGYRWKLYEDIVANNPEDSKVNVYSYDTASDTSLVISTKNTWIDPTDRSAPIKGNGHKAEKEEQFKEEKSEQKKPKKQKKQTNFRGVIFTNLTGKKN